MPSLSLPIPPSANHYLGSRRGQSKRFLTQRAKDFFTYVAVALNECDHERILNPNRVRLHIDVWWPDERDHNGDNLFKCVADALAKGGAYENDRQVKDWRVVECGIDRDDPRVEVHWEPMEERR